MPWVAIYYPLFFILTGWPKHNNHSIKGPVCPSVPAHRSPWSPAPRCRVLPATQDIPSGAEACISCGCTHKSSEQLMRDYGFVLPGNLNDRVPFTTGWCLAGQQ